MKLSLPHTIGHAMINNALITIKHLSGIQSTAELSTEMLRKLVLRISDDLPYSLMDLNLRFKSYTMLFSKNGPLLNDKLGKLIYQQLLLKIIDNFENTGPNRCILSSMQYNKSFSDLYAEVLKDLKVPEIEIKKKDLTINRCWFPLLGGLGSDAQSLPMAKYTYDIHPIFIVILQFIPLSSLLYKGGILLMDSPNGDFNEKFIAKNLNEVIKKTLATSITEPIENIKDLSKGNYLLRSLSIMEQMNLDYGYIDIHLWSFSNSGTGASCEIDRLPNQLLNRLRTLYNNSCRKELTDILSNAASATTFIRSLEDSTEWYGLYPSKKSEGVSVEFFEMYWKTLGRQKETEMAKYIAYLISIYKSKSFEKILSKLDAYNDSNYHNELNAVLLTAVNNGKWSFNHHLYIQTDKESVPINTGYWHLLKLTYFYFYKGEFTDVIPALSPSKSTNAQITKWILSLIESDTNRAQIISLLRDSQNYNNVLLSELFIRNIHHQDIDIFKIFSILYDKNGKLRTLGILSLLRFYYLEQANNTTLPVEITELPDIYIPADFKRWIQHIHQFVEDYIEYRLGKVIIKEKKKEYLEKILAGIPKTTSRQRIWLNDIMNRLNEYNDRNNKSIWTEEIITYDPLGNHNFYITILVFRMKTTEMIKNEDINIEF